MMTRGGYPEFLCSVEEGYILQVTLSLSLEQGFELLTDIVLNYSKDLVAQSFIFVFFILLDHFLLVFRLGIRRSVRPI